MGEHDSGYAHVVRLVCIVGARPNFMKVKPVLDALAARGLEGMLVHTGQHYDNEMSDVFFDDLQLRRPDRHLGIGSGTQAEQTARVMIAFESLVKEVNPDIVVVVGDVNSTMACAIVAAKAECVLAHVEAGLRSGDWSMPEEINRVVTDCVSDYLFAPSSEAVENLRAEGHGDDQIFFVGNVMVDTMLANAERVQRSQVLGRLDLEPRHYGLVTLHRPSNVDDPETLGGLLTALARLAEDLPLVFPAHPRTRPRVEEIGVPTGLRLIQPVGYLDFLALEADAALVLTDSGGVQEETTVFGVPCLTLRETTERPVTVTDGTNTVVGKDPARILEEARRALENKPRGRRPPRWDGRAGERIAEVLVEGKRRAGRRLPTERASLAR